MLWLECRAVVLPESIDDVCWTLFDSGISGVEIEDAAEMREFLQNEADGVNWDYIDERLLTGGEETTVRFYLPSTRQGKDALSEITKALERAVSGGASITYRTVDDETWLYKWKEFYKPFQITRGITVCPNWEECEPADGIVFRINPGNVFGTGLHLSTQLAAGQLTRLVNKNSAVLDIGSGSGILGIIAVLLGAEYAALVDTDPAAKTAALENAALNRVEERIEVHTGNIIANPALFAQIAQKRYDLVIANITADVILALLPVIPPLFKQNAVFLASGIIGARLKDVTDALERCGCFTGLKVIYPADNDTEQNEGWCALICEFSRPANR